MVFTDVVESSATKRDASLGRDSRERDHAYLEKVQSRYFTLIRDCYRAHGGKEVSTMGDAFYLVFEDPLQATRCAREIQRKLEAEPIETPRGPLQLRIGIHTGYGEMFEGTYHGTDVDTAARVEALGSAQQILLSSATYALVRNMADVTFHRMGEFALKGIGREVVWEADWDGRGPRPTAVPPITIQQRKQWAKLAGGVAALLVVALVAAYFVVRRQRSRGLTDKDTLVLADFANTTGDAVFDGTLRQALIVKLQESPFLNILSEDEVRETLKLMSRSPDERVTREVAREICQRAGAKAMVAGSISQLGSSYVLGLDALDCSSGTLLSATQVQAASKDQVLSALNRSAVELRGKLGESLPSIQKFNTPIEQATTASLDALKAYSLARETHYKEGDPQAIPLYQRAIALDPQFAMAYMALGVSYANLGELARSRDNLQKGYALANRVSERERLYITAQYYSFASGELDKAKQAYQVWTQMYPRDYVAYGDLGFIDASLGDFAGSIDATRHSLVLNPRPVGYANLIGFYLCLNRADEAQAVYQEAMEHKIDHYLIRQQHYYLAFAQNDTETMKREAAWGAGLPGVEDIFMASEADTAAYYGRLREAEQLSQRAAESARRNQERETAAGWMATAALRQALYENSEPARRRAAAAVALSHGHDVDAIAGFTLALVGAGKRAEALINQLNREFPLDTILQHNYLPEIHAEIALRGGDPAKAIDLLQAAAPYEMGQSFLPILTLLPVYERGRAYLQAGNGSAAAAEFQKVIDRPGYLLNSPLGPLAKLGLARALALAGEKDKSRAAYQDFLAIWKNADPDVPVLREAKAEYAKLQ